MAPAGSKAASAKPMFRKSKSALAEEEEAHGTKRSLSQVGPSGYKDCPLIARLPKLLRTGDWVEDAKRGGIRDDWEELLNILWHEQQYISPLIVYLRKLRKRDDGAADRFDPEPTTFGKLEKEYVVGYLAAPSDKMSYEWFDKMDMADSEFIGSLLCLLLHLPCTMPVPKQLYSKSVMSTFLTWRMGEVKRLGYVVKNVTTESYKKVTGGPYELVFDDSKLTKVKRISGDVATVPGHINITKAFNLKHWHSDLNATLVLEPLPLNVKDFFPQGQGPHKQVMTKENITTKAQEFLMAKADAEQKGQAPAASQILKLSKAATSEKKLAEQAKKTLAKHREEKGKRQRVQLG